MKAPPPPTNPEFIKHDPWFAHLHQSLKVTEVAEALDISGEQVRMLLDEGFLVGICVNDARIVKRKHYRIERWSVVAYLLNQAEDMGEVIPMVKTSYVIYWQKELRNRSQFKASAINRLKKRTG